MLALKGQLGAGRTCGSGSSSTSSYGAPARRVIQSSRALAPDAAHWRRSMASVVMAEAPLPTWGYIRLAV